MTTALPPSPSAPRAKSTRGAAGERATRDNIIRAALTLFAKHGIDGVSLRQIVAAAGQSNPSAVHYHFQSKDGLLSAVVDHVNEQLQPLQRQAMDALFAAQAQGGLTVRELVSTAIMPFVTLYASSYEGRMAIRFLSRLTWQRDVVGQSRLFDSAWSYWRDVVVVLHALMPQQSIDVLMHRGVLVGCTLLHGLADMSILSRQTSFGLSDMFKEHPLVLLDHLCDFVTGGLVAPTSAPAFPRAQAA